MTLKRWFAGFFLLILMVTALFVNSILFSARSFQHNLASVAPQTGGVISIAELNQVDAAVTLLENQTAPQRGEAAQLEQQAAAAQRDLDNARDALAALQAKALTQTSELENAAGITPAAASGEFNPVDVAQRLDRISAQRAAATQTRDGIVEVRVELGKIGEAEQGLGPKEDDLAKLEGEKRRAGEFVATSERTILGLKGQFGGDFQRIRNEARALIASSPFGVGEKLVGMHPTFLSTVLVCIMGALGALLYLFPAYLNPSSKILFADIVVRLVFGMVVALAFYIVANASLAGFAFVPGGDTGAASLNPFTVSLLGIIAGIMADDIAAWIHKRGRDILGGGASPDPVRPSVAAPSGGGGLANPRGGAADPYASAAQDARATHQAGPAPGDAPPRGGVVG